MQERVGGPWGHALDCLIGSRDCLIGSRREGLASLTSPPLSDYAIRRMTTHRPDRTIRVMMSLNHGAHEGA